MLCASAIQKLKHDKSLKIEDIAQALPDYSSPCERVKLCLCGTALLLFSFTFAAAALFGIASKVIDFEIDDDAIQIVRFLQGDWHYCLLVPVLFPLSVILGWFGWLGFKLYRHN